MSVFKDAGLLIIGSRLKRLGDRFLNEVSRVYKNQNIRFEPGWFPLFYLLDKKGSLSLTEIAAELDVSHSAISQMITQLLNKKLVEIQQNSSDARIKKIIFSTKGEKIVEQIHPVWSAFQKSLTMVLPQEIDPDTFLNLIWHMEEKLSNNFLSDTTLGFIRDQSPDIEILTPDTILIKKLQIWAKNEKTRFPDDPNLHTIALHRNNIVGFTSFSLLEKTMHLRSIYVHPFQRRKGIALKMLQYVVEEHMPECIQMDTANLDLIKVLIKSGYSFKVK